MITGFFSGIFAYIRAIGLISKLKLGKYLIIPGLLSILLAFGIGSTAWGLSDNLGAIFLKWGPIEWISYYIPGLTTWLSGALVLLIGFILLKHLVMVIVSPFMSILSHKIEQHLQGGFQVDQGFNPAKAVKDLIRGLRIAVGNIFKELLFVILLLPLHIIPGIGTIIYTVLIFIIQAYYAGYGNMDYTMERHLSFGETKYFVRKNRGLAIGNGAVFLALLLTGIGFLFAPPLATIAATTVSLKQLGITNAGLANDKRLV